MGAFVYILRCADRSYYVGSATGDDLSKRFAEHQSGAYPGYTFSRRPVTFEWSEHFERIADAIAVERKLKGWSRAKKEALIRGDWILVKTLAKRRGGAPKLSQSSESAAAILRGSLRSHLRMTGRSRCGKILGR